MPLKQKEAYSSHSLLLTWDHTLLYRGTLKKSVQNYKNTINSKEKGILEVLSITDSSCHTYS